jgi:hypothetical protein
VKKCFRKKIGRKNATEMQNAAELKLLKGDVIYDGMACRTMNDVTADCQSAKYEEKNKREPDDSRTE